MKGGKRPLGYTIVEVMIVLAVSGMMFIIAANFIDGKQARTSFSQSANETASRIQGVISDVTDGRYSDVPITCNQTSAGSPLNIAASGTINQGKNSECVFLGKMLHFRKDDPNYEVFSLAAARLQPNGNLVTNLAQAQATVITDLTSEEIIPNQLQVKSMNIIPAVGNAPNRWAAGFVQGFGKADASGTPSYASGARTINIVYSDLGPAVPRAAASGQINSASYPQEAKGFIMCLSDGQRFAEIRVGKLSPGASGESTSSISVQTKVVTVCS